MSVLTRIKNNQITDSTILANTKIVPGTIVGSLFNANLTMTSDVTITGNLTVQGSSTYLTVASTNTYVNDPLIVMNNAFSGTNTYDLGFIFNRGSLTTAALVWDEGNDEFRFGYTTETGTTYGSINNSGYANVKVGNITVTGIADIGSVSMSGDILVGNITAAGDLAVNGGDLTTNQTTFNLVNTTATTLNIGGAATALTLGATSGNTDIRNNLNVTGGATFGSINNTPIGNAVPSTGAFTTLNSNGTTQLGLTSATALNSTPIGNATPSTGAFTTLTSTGNVSFGLATASAINNTPIGNATPSTGAFTTLAASGITQITNATQSNSTSVGALTITGGVGVGANLYAGGNVVAQRVITTLNATYPLANYDIAGAYIHAQNTLNLGTGGDGSISWGEGASPSVLQGNPTEVALRINNNTNKQAWRAFSDGQLLVGVGEAPTSARLTVNGNARITDTSISNSTSTGALIVAGGVGVGGNLYANNVYATNSLNATDLTLAGDLAVDGGDLTTTATTFNLLNTTVQTANILQNANLITLGQTSGSTNVRNNLNVYLTLEARDINNTVIGNTAPAAGTFTSLTDQSLTSGRVVLAGTGGNLEDSANLTFSSGNLTVQNFVINGSTGAISVSGGGANVTLKPNVGGVIDASGATVSNVADPIDSQDAVTLFYLNTALSSSVSNLVADDSFLQLTDNGTNPGNLTANIDGAEAFNVTANETAFYTDFVVLDDANAAVTISGDLAVNGGDLTTNQTTFNLVNSTATTVNFAGAATTLDIGAATGTVTINNGNIWLPNATSINSVANNVNLLTSPSSAINAFTNAIDITIGKNLDGQTLIDSANTKTAGNLTVQSTEQSTNASTGALVVNGGVGVAKDLNVGGNVVITGNLQVDGAVTSVNTATLDVEDLNITVAKGAGSAAAANGAGLTVDGASATFTYANSDDSWNVNKLLKGTSLNFTNGATIGETLSARDINSTVIGNVTPAAATFTSANIQNSLTAAVSGAINLSANTFTVSSTNTGTIDNFNIGATTAGTGTFTTLTSTNTTQLGLTSATAINSTPIGNATASSGAFTTLTASGVTQITDATDATAVGTGAFRVTGGASVGGNLYVGGNINIVGSSYVLTGNAGVFYGDINGFGALYAGVTGYTTLPSTVFQTSADINNYAQNNFENVNTGAKASTDWVATAGDGGDYDHYINMGITTSNWDGTQDNSLTNALGGNDGYLYVQGNITTGTGGNLTIGASTPGTKKVSVIVGGNTSSNITAVFNNAGTQSTSKTSGALTVNGGVGISGNLYANNLNVTNNVAFDGDLAVNGGDLTTNQTTFNLVNTTATTLNVGGAATTLSLGATSGTTSVNNNLDVDLSITARDINSTVIGNTSPAAATFTTLDTTGNASLGLTSATAINNTPIGNATPSTGAFTTVSTTGNVSTSGILYANAGIASTRFDNGSIIANGGVGVAGNINIANGSALKIGMDLVGANSSPVNASLRPINVVANINADSLHFFRNINPGENATTTYVASSDTATFDRDFLSFGQICSGWTNDIAGVDGSIQAHDSFILSSGANLVIGMNGSRSNKIIKFGIGPYDANIVAKITENDENFQVTSTIASNDYQSGALVVSGGVGVNGNVNIRGGKTLRIGLDLGGNANVERAVNVITSSNTDEQVYIRNLSSGANATAIFTAVADNGNPDQNFVSMGIASSGFNRGLAIKSNDAFILGQGGNLVLATGALGSQKIKFAAGGVFDQKVLLTIDGDTQQISLGNGALSGSTTSGALIVNGGVGISSNINIGNGAVINSSQSSDNFTVKGVNTTSLIHADSNYGAVVIGGSNASPQLGATLKVNSTDSLLIPAGSTAERPSNTGNVDVAGMIRFNTSTTNFEYYTGSSWNVAGSDTTFTIITSEQFTGNGTANVYSLAGNTTTNGTIVSINGIVQLPTVSYSVTGNQLTFSEPPADGDLIDVRTLTTTKTAGAEVASSNGFVTFTPTDAGGAQIFSGSGGKTLRASMETDGVWALKAGTKSSYDQTAISANTSPTVIDSFAAGDYSSAKYVVQAKNGTDIESMEALLIHDSANAYVTTYAIINNGNVLGTLGASILAGVVQLQYTALSTANVKVYSTYIV